MMSRACVCLWRSGCARGRKTCMLVAGPPRDGIIRTSPGQECSKDKGALPGARRIFVYAARSWSAAGYVPSVWFRSWLLILHPDEERVSLYPAKRQSARSSMDRASDYGSEGWGFESLRARSGPLGAIHRWGFCILESTPAGVLFYARFATVTVPARRCCGFRGCGARGRWRGLAGLRDDAPSRRLAARTASGRAAAHGRIKQPGPTVHSKQPSGTGRRHDPRLGRQRTQPLNPQCICDIGGATRPGHSQGRPNEGHDVRGGPAQAS